MTAREAALRAICDVDKNGSYTNAALKKALGQELFSTIDKGLITELVYGVVSNKIAIDYIISQFSKLKLKKMSVWVLNILRMGIYQIYYMDKIPSSAACNEAVILAKKYSHGAGSGFVNGVLRAAVRGCDKFSFPKTDDIVKDLSLEYSYPEWMTTRIVKEYGENTCRELFEEIRKPHLSAIRVNSLKINRIELEKRLVDEGLECVKHKELENALMVKGKLNIDSSASYKDGLFSLQNISSQKVIDVLSPQPDEVIIDMCAAPGGKSCSIAERMANKGRVLAFDVFEHKVELIKKSAERLGINIIDANVRDATINYEDMINSADRVLADVPCSGLGVIHKKPDIKWTRNETDIEELCKIQEKILKNAALYVKTGGVLVYSTCTILPEENRFGIEKFLKAHNEFEKEYEEQILTTELGESGFYICRMVKKQ
jgi:16S rRNA (cytosine967-C5)-methyltransferase